MDGYERMECAFLMCETDSPDDLPSTVKALTPDDRMRREMQQAFSGQGLLEDKSETQDGIYIWRQADLAIKHALKMKGYFLLESRIFADCIGYRCRRNGDLYTVYMYAFGRKKTIQIDGDYCGGLLTYEFSQDSTVLVSYLQVQKILSEKGISYQTSDYAGHTNGDIEFWRVDKIGNKQVFLYYPRKEMIDMISKLMYVFNRQAGDVYECIICDENPAFFGLDLPGAAMNGAFFGALRSIRETYGEMKLGYVRFNDVVYCQVPYIEGFGFFSFRVNLETNRIFEVTAHPFEGRNQNVKEFIKTQIREDPTLYAHIPTLERIEPLEPVDTERFALKLLFDNGECRKYVLPIAEETEHDEVVSYCRHAFTDKIWRSAAVIKELPDKRGRNLERGASIAFKNGFSVSGMRCYEESRVYIEPVLCDEVIYEDERLRIVKEWDWSVAAIYIDEETKLLKTLISGQAFNYGGVSTFAGAEGKMRYSVDFDYIDDFHSGLACVGKIGYGMGYIDRNMNFVIPMQYDSANRFINGRARVKRGDQWIFLDQAGKETPLCSHNAGHPYEDVGDYYEGLCKVSTLKLRSMDLAYYSDYEFIAGIWGFVDENGVEVVPPQYIYAYDFSGGLAVVCKGKWTIDPKWDNRYNTGRYWTDEERWGAIDKSGAEVIPFIFDEIKFFDGADDIFAAHYGGWENGKWGVIDSCGNWLAEPVFYDIGYSYQDGLFAFYDKGRWADDVLMGIYDIGQKKVLFEPQFKSVDFLENGEIEVELFDESLGRPITKLIDRQGREKFHSIYSTIFSWEKPYVVKIYDKQESYSGLIEEDGTVIVPCEYNVPFDGFDTLRNRMFFVENEKQGIRSFAGEILVEPIYEEIRGKNEPLLTVYIREEEERRAGMIRDDGKEVLPTVFKNISWYGEDHLICHGEDGYMMLRLDWK